MKFENRKKTNFCCCFWVSKNLKLGEREGFAVNYWQIEGFVARFLLVLNQVFAVRFGCCLSQSMMI